jgi:hypothetical protein
VLKKLGNRFGEGKITLEQLNREEEKIKSNLRNQLRSWKLQQNGNTGMYIFGKMNPVTRGHKSLIKMLVNIEKNTGIKVYVSTSDPKKLGRNRPINTRTRIRLLKKMFPNLASKNRIFSSRNIFTAAHEIKDKGKLSKLILVGGSNRAPTYSKIAGGKNKQGNPYPMNFFYPVVGQRLSQVPFEQFKSYDKKRRKRHISGTFARAAAENNAITTENLGTIFPKQTNLARTRETIRSYKP